MIDLKRRFHPLSHTIVQDLLTICYFHVTDSPKNVNSCQTEYSIAVPTLKCRNRTYHAIGMHLSWPSRGTAPRYPKRYTLLEMNVHICERLTYLTIQMNNQIRAINGNENFRTCLKVEYGTSNTTRMAANYNPTRLVWCGCRINL